VASRVQHRRLNLLAWDESNMGDRNLTEAVVHSGGVVGVAR